MTLLQANPEIANVPLTWYALGILAAFTVINFLFQGENSFMRLWWARVVKKGDTQIGSYERRIAELQVKVNELTDKLDFATKQMASLQFTIQQHENTIRSYRKTMDLIEKYIKNIAPTDDFYHEFFNSIKEDPATK